MLKEFKGKSSSEIVEQVLTTFRKQQMAQIKHDIAHAQHYEIEGILAALFSAGYRPFSISDDEIISKSRKFELQRRVDTSYPSIPICACNDKVFVNATVYVHDYPNGDHMVNKSVELHMTHELTDYEWIKLQPYGMPLSFFEDSKSVLEQERKIVTLWAYAHAIYNDKL